MNYTYYVDGMECESCAKVISNVVSAFPGSALMNADAKEGRIVLECPEGTQDDILKAVKEKGYFLSATPFERKVHDSIEGGVFERAGAYVRGVVNGREGYSLERELLENSLASFILILVLELFFSFMLSPTYPNLLADYKAIFVLLAFTVSMNSYSVWHSIAYRKEFTCMSGMMVGMTLGMMSGFMVGVLIGATNGMFAGSVVGMVVGMIVGAYCGKCCGIMGILEGLMAGIMSGIMGAMTSVMLFSDHLVEFLFLLFAACGIVLAGLSYMIFKEAGSRREESVGPSRIDFIALNIIVSVILFMVIVLAPKGRLVLGSG